MTAAVLSTLVTDFFMVHLGKERNASRHTTTAYRDSLKMFLCFAAKLRSRTIDRLELEDLSVDVILEFLNYLEKERGNTVQTRNLRLTAIHSFFRYVLSREPALASFCQRVLAIPFKKTTRRSLGYLTEEEMKSLLDHVSRNTARGERDYVLIALLYDTGARVQELLDLKPSAFRLEKPAFVRVTGKGRKERLCPLLPQTARLVSNFLAEQGHKDAPCFLNRYGQQLSRHGARYVLKKYLAVAQQEIPLLGRPGISPHSLRHTKAMHLLQAGIPPVTIRDILGHADIKSTEVYVETDMEMRRKALERVGTPSRAKKRGKPLSRDLLKWLESL
ncbi:MAG: tyrosine-type recombinase/integrase [Syntrophorhabdales bacterium]|jgi:site-specific recombinase XerD